MDNLASQSLLRFYWMNKYTAFLLYIWSLSAFELLISDGRWCDSCHRSVGDDRIRAEVREHWHVPVDGTVGTGLASISSVSLLLYEVCDLLRVVELLCQLLRGSKAPSATFGFHKATVFCTRASHCWPYVKSGVSIADLKAFFIQDLFHSHLIRSKQVQSYQAFYIFCIIYLCFSKLISFKENSVVGNWCLDSARRLTCWAVVIQPRQPR